MTTNKPFPWTCCDCLNHTVVPAIIDYNCPVYSEDGSSTKIVIKNLEVVQCGHCQEVFFTRSTNQRIYEEIAKVK